MANIDTNTLVLRTGNSLFVKKKKHSAEKFSKKTDIIKMLQIFIDDIFVMCVHRVQLLIRGLNSLVVE